MPRQQKPAYTNDLMRYAGLSAQIIAGLGIAVFAGYKADRWLKLSFPIFIWFLPVVVLCMMMYKLVKETSNRKTDNDQKKI